MWEKIAHRLTADFLVGDRVFEIVLESLGLSLESRALWPAASKSVTALPGAPSFPFIGFSLRLSLPGHGHLPLHAPDHGLEDGLQAALGLGGASDSCFSGFFGEVADKMGET